MKTENKSGCACSLGVSASGQRKRESENVREEIFL